MSGLSPQNGGAGTGEERYYRYGRWLRETFGCRVHKISLDAGFDCPNRDGTVGRGGCLYCDPRAFSPSRRQQGGTLGEQLERGIERVRRFSRARKFLAYLQPATNTYGPVDVLRRVFAEAIDHADVVGLAVSTRPDCAPEAVLDLLADVAERVHVTVEYGLQSIHDATLQRVNRGHDYAAFLDAVERTRRRGLAMCAHVILGLPGEDAEAMWATAAELGRLALDGVKIHNLHVLRDTPLAAMHARGEAPLLELDAYVAVASRFLEYLHPRTAIHRLSGDAPAEHLVAPDWCRKKALVRHLIEQDLVARDTRQGARCPSSRERES